MAVGVWTNNWRAAKNSMLIAREAQGLSTFVSITGTTASSDYDRTSVISPLLSHYSSSNSRYWNRPSSYTISFVFGAGQTTPTATDYALESEITPLAYVSQTSSISKDVQNGTFSRTYKVVVQNQESVSKTIKEWGIYAVTTGSSYIMLYRALLDTPVTLAQYESAEFTVTITMELSDPV